MKTFKFEVAEHKEFGGLGFKPSWYPAGDPLPGMAVAHDILEHFPKDTGTAEEEYMALGASLLIRGDSGYFGYRGGNSDPEANIASDLPTIWGVQPHVRPCSLSKDTCLMDSTRAAVNHFRQECKYMGDCIPTELDFENIARWIARGYQRARKRYDKIGVNRVAWSLFQPIEEQADRYLKHAEEGMILTIKIDFSKMSVKVDCDYPYDSEEY